MTPSSILRKSPAVGIDLGTTYSVVAYLDDTGRPMTIVNSEGDLITPSAVLFDGETTVVGKEAIKAIASEAEHVAMCAKRDLGERAFHRVIEGHRYPPEAIQAWVLNKIKNDAQRQLGPISRVVITVPAYFDEVRRKATQDAGFMAGLEVMDIINEPTAAAVAFGFQQGFLNAQGGAPKPQKILVYDLGGGTFDVTVMEISGTNFNALATDGDVRLGGQDWDQRIVDFVAEEFIRQHKIDPREDPNAAGRLWRECEDAKRTLSLRSKAAINYDFKGAAVRLEITREKFEEITICSTARVSPRGKPCKPPVSHGKISTASSSSVARLACRWSARCSRKSPAKTPTPRSRPMRRSPTARRCTPGFLSPAPRGIGCRLKSRTLIRTASESSRSTARRAAREMRS